MASPPRTASTTCPSHYFIHSQHNETLAICPCPCRNVCGIEGLPRWLLPHERPRQHAPKERREPLQAPSSRCCVPQGRQQRTLVPSHRLHQREWLPIFCPAWHQQALQSRLLGCFESQQPRRQSHHY